MLGLLWYLQRRFAGGAAKRRDAEAITVLGRQNLGAKAQLVVVQTADARYVLGVTEHGVNVVDKLPSDDETDAVTSVIDASSASQHPQNDDRSGAATAFDGVLASASATPVPQLRRRVRHRSDPLRGSIISPETWRQTAEALRRSR